MLIVIGFLCGAYRPGSAQSIVRIVKGYVLIDTDQGLGNIGQTISVFRKTGDQYKDIGQVSLVRFRDGMAAAKIENLTKPFLIRIGDRVSKRDMAETDRRKSTSLSIDKQHKVKRVVSGYVLIETNERIGNIDDKIQIGRREKQSIVEVGSVRLMKIIQGKTAAKILQENTPYRITAGDFIIYTPSDLDIDYYFMDGFTPQQKK